MGKLEYLDALKRAMTGLPPEAQAKTLAFYEQRFVDGVAAGRSEQDVAAELDDPKKIAMTLRANAHMQAFATKKNPANGLRMVVAVLGLAIFNLFMLVPAMVYAALLATLYACGLAFYLAGTVITASGLSGANEIRLEGPLRNVFVHNGHGDNDGMQTKVNISEEGIQIFSERDPAAKDQGKKGQGSKDQGSKDQGADVQAASDQGAKARAAVENATAHARAAASAAARTAALATSGSVEAATRAAEDAGAAAEAAATAAEEASNAAEEAAAAAVSAVDDEDAEQDGDKRSVRAIRRAESVASQGIVFSTDTDEGSRTTQTFFGLAMVLGGIVLLLLSLVITRYTFIGLKRYIEMNYSLLKGN